MADLKLQLEAIQDIYTNIILEKVESKFKVGDKVGIGGMQDHDPMNYKPLDTGVISKTERGVHHVTFDNMREHTYFPADKDKTPNIVHKFGANGKSTTENSVRIIPMEDHTKRVTTFEENRVRKDDLNGITHQIQNMRNGYGNYAKLSKDHVATIKAILDKHTEE